MFLEKFRGMQGGNVRKLLGCAACLLLVAAMPLTAQAPGVSEMYAQIRAEETNNSKIMWIIHEVADVYGPRDGHAELEGGRRVGGQNDDVVGTDERASGAVDLPAAERGQAGARLGKHGAFGGSRYAVPRTTDGEAAGVDAEHEGNRDGASGDGGAARIGAADGRWI